MSKGFRAVVRNVAAFVRDPVVVARESPKEGLGTLANVTIPGLAFGAVTGKELIDTGTAKEGGIAPPGVESVPTEIDQKAVEDARRDELEKSRKRKGRASTIVRKQPGLLSGETTGTLLGS